MEGDEMNLFKDVFIEMLVAEKTREYKKGGLEPVWTKLSKTSLKIDYCPPNMFFSPDSKGILLLSSFWKQTAIDNDDGVDDDSSFSVTPSFFLSVGGC